jgi:hypothetical protein
MELMNLTYQKETACRSNKRNIGGGSLNCHFLPKSMLDALYVRRRKEKSVAGHADECLVLSPAPTPTKHGWNGIKKESLINRG